MEKISGRAGSGATRVSEASQNRAACAAAPLKERREPTSCHLTTAERKVLALVSLAKTNKEIAVALCISPATVKRHVENLLRKLELRNRVEAAIYGLLLAGCPRGHSSACPLEMWHREKAATNRNWAD